MDQLPSLFRDSCDFRSTGIARESAQMRPSGLHTCPHHPCLWVCFIVTEPKPFMTCDSTMSEKGGRRYRQISDKLQSIPRSHAGQFQTVTPSWVSKRSRVTGPGCRAISSYSVNISVSFSCYLLLLFLLLAPCPLLPYTGIALSILQLANS
jgi:hypothetical protein